MHRRIRRVVTTLAALAACAGLHAADQIGMRSDRFSLRATVADNELHVEGAAVAAAPGLRAAPGARGTSKLIVAGGRAAVQAAARTLLAAGNTVRADPILYLDGKVGDPAYRAIATRRVLIGVAPGTNIVAVADAHGLRLTKPVNGRPNWWIAEPLSTDVYAAVDAAATLAQDPRATVAMPILQMPVQSYAAYDPNDPVYLAGYQWHLSDTFPGIRVREVWGTWKGLGTNVAVTDGGTQIDHPDLAANVRTALSYDYFHDDANPSPETTADNHGTAVSGMAAAVGNNLVGTTSTPTGVVGVAFQAGIIASKVLHDYDPNAIGATTLAPDDRMRDAITKQATSSDSDDLTWANNNSWGPGGQSGSPLPLLFAGMQDATTYGRGGHGIPIIFACGNSGDVNPNNVQGISAFDGYLNRYTIGVAALSNLPAGHKASYSSSGPNIITSAPGGDAVHSQTGLTVPGVLGVSTTDRTGNDGYAHYSAPANCDFDGNGVVYPGATALPYENGDYVPPTYHLAGTSFAAPIVTGCATLMQQARPALSWRDVRQLLILRGQDQVPLLPEFVPTGGAKPHDDWGYWRPNGVNLNYNNWYGFGAVDMGRLVFGGDGSEANALIAGALDEPGSLRWPLLPPLLADPLTYNTTFPLPADGDTDPTALYDAPKLTVTMAGEVNAINRELVWDGRKIEGLGTRICNVTMPITTAPTRFRVDTVELTVTLQGVGPSTYGTSTLPRGSLTPTYNWGQYAFSLTSPSGATCILGRQRPGTEISDGAVTPFSWTFSEVFHTNESLVNGDWILSVIDEVNNLDDDTASDPDNWNPPEARITAVALAIYGHQTYAQPTLTSTSRSGLPSGKGNQSVTLRGSGFARSQANLGVTQAYWHPGSLAGTPVEIPTSVTNSGEVIATVPTALLDTSTPGEGFVTIANPAVVVGRSATDAATAIDVFDNPYPATPLPSTSATNPSRYMKRCVDGDAKRIKYSRPPTLTPIADIVLKNGGGFAPTSFANDPDAAVGLPLSLPEVLTVTATSFNPGLVPNPSVNISVPNATGIGNYTISGTTNGSASGFALIQVKVTDGVTETVQSFRVIIPSDESASGCGGGMGLALLGIPLGVWLIRRRKRA